MEKLMMTYRSKKMKNIISRYYPFIFIAGIILCCSALSGNLFHKEGKITYVSYYKNTGK